MNVDRLERVAAYLEKLDFHLFDLDVAHNRNGRTCALGHLPNIFPEQFEYDHLQNVAVIGLLAKDPYELAEKFLDVSEIDTTYLFGSKSYAPGAGAKEVAMRIRMFIKMEKTL